jgi:superoxide dismutase
LLQGLNPKNKHLEIVTTANQDPLLTHIPIIGVDIWEHAFYLQYLNVKVDVRVDSYSFSLDVPVILPRLFSYPPL